MHKPSPTLRANRGLFTNIPMAIFVIAVGASLLHMAPYWRAQLQAPPGWAFTGNLSISPDYMQYRVWERLASDHGPIVANTFTAEPNQPHLPVFFYYLIGKAATLLNASPEAVYAYSGALIAFVFVLALFITVRLFFEDKSSQAWVFGSLLLGGGLGAHLKILSRYDFLRNNYLLRRILVEGVWTGLTFEDYRGSYIFTTLFDTHFLLIWLIMTAALVALYTTLNRFSPVRLVATLSLYGLATLLHLYEGVTLLVITASVLLLLWRKGLANRSAYLTASASGVVVIAVLIWQFSLVQSSGLPVPDWRAQSILASTLILAYPLAGVAIIFGGAHFWQRGGLSEVFLIGWALGATLVVLSGPFYPYPDRGIVSLQIPLFIITSLIYFTHYRRVTWPVAVVILMVLLATPAQALQNQWEATNFDPGTPAIFIHSDHRQILDALRERATAGDILISDMRPSEGDPPWETDVLWLAPEYPGKFYCAHFFLTVNFEAKCRELDRFYGGSPNSQISFLRENDVRFVFVPAYDDPTPFHNLEGLNALVANPTGTLFEFTPSAGASG